MHQKKGYKNASFLHSPLIPGSCSSIKLMSDRKKSIFFPGIRKWNSNGVFHDFPVNFPRFSWKYICAMINVWKKNWSFHRKTKETKLITSPALVVHFSHFSPPAKIRWWKGRKFIHILYPCCERDCWKGREEMIGCWGVGETTETEFIWIYLLVAKMMTGSTGREGATKDSRVCYLWIRLFQPNCSHSGQGVM